MAARRSLIQHLIRYGASIQANEKGRTLECKIFFNYKFNSGYGLMISNTAISPSRVR
jgi:hypothetical protein